MNQIKIGKFIQASRKDKNLTQDKNYISIYSYICTSTNINVYHWC